MENYLGIGLGGTSVLGLVLLGVRAYMKQSKCVMKVGDTTLDIGELQQEIAEATKEGVKEETILNELKQTLHRVKTKVNVKDPAEQV